MVQCRIKTLGFWCEWRDYDDDMIKFINITLKNYFDICVEFRVI